MINVVIYKQADYKIKNFKDHEIEIAAEISKLKNKKMEKRFTLVRISAYCCCDESYQESLLFTSNKFAEEAF